MQLNVSCNSKIRQDATHYHGIVTFLPFITTACISLSEKII